VEGQDLVLEYRFAEGRLDRHPDLAADLVRRHVDVIVAGGWAPFMRPNTRTIAMVMTSV
jgi:putative ABC transport system substrate-binding protein